MLREVQRGWSRGKKKRGANIPSYPITGDKGDLDRGRMVVFGHGGDACGSTITFHSGSLRDENMKEQRREKRNSETLRRRWRKKKKGGHLAVKVINEGSLVSCCVLSFVVS